MQACATPLLVMSGFLCLRLFETVWWGGNAGTQAVGCPRGRSLHQQGRGAQEAAGS